MTAKAMMLTATAALLLVTGGCTKKVGGQVVAIVNGQEITQQELNGELSGVVIPPGADKKAVMAQVLQRVIDRKLMAGKARKEGLDQSPAYLGQVQRAQDAILINLLAGKLAKNIAVPDAAAVDRFTADNATRFSDRKRYDLEQVGFAMPNDPVLVKKLQAAKTMDAVTTALKEAGVPYQSGKGALDTAGIPTEAAKRIAALAPGEPFLVPQNNQMVASSIRSSETVTVPPAQAKSGAALLLRNQAVDKAMRQQSDAERAAAKIQYAQGFAPPKPMPAAAAH